ncbi:MAG: M56 family metallopeptidase [Ferruginibacter sp.]|nr:M56 family metallopeptidase [Chitinophagaceae bacterium]
MTGQGNLLQSLGWAVLNSLWQLALLWVLYQVLTGIFRNVRSSIKSSLAFSLLAGGFSWFIYTFLSAFLSHGDTPILSSAIVNAEANEQVNAWLQQTLPVASILYLALLVLPLLHFVRNYRYVQVVRKYGLTKMHVEWRMFVSKVCTQMSIKKTVRLWVSEFVSSPVTIGFLKPVILVPLAAINHLTPQQLEAVLLHELSHIRRFDYLINLIINLVQSILYFNPFAKAFVKIIEREREKSCDEMVLQFQYDSHEYATALLMLEKVNIANKPLAVAATGKKNDLLQRIELIMGIYKKPAFSFNRLATLMAGVLCIIAFNALLLSNRTLNGSRVASFAFRSSPINFIKAGNPVVKKEVAVAVEQPSRVVNHVKEDRPALALNPSFASYISAAANPGLQQASLEIAEAPLKKYQEVQVERVMEASRKVLENVQWKVVERSIADVFTQKEKEALKASYEKEIGNFDWNKWETQLKLAYDKIDWEKINTQLTVAVNQVRMDSIQMVYNKAISKIDGISKELCLKDMKGIPDTDITLKELDRKKAEVQKALNELKAVRSKKIVHL